MMMAIEHSALIWPIVFTGLAPLFIWLLRGNINAREGMSFAAGVLTFGTVLTFVPPVLNGQVLVYPLFMILPGIEVKFGADGLGLIFALVASFLWILATAYNIGYMRSLKEHAQTRYYFCFAVAIFGAVGVALAANVFTLYLFYEVITVFTYPLVAHHQDEEGYEGGKKYLTYLTTTAKGRILPAMVVLYVLSGTLDFAHDVHTGILPPDAHNGVVTALYICCILGFAKNGIMPLHHWLPGAMVAPTPVSALLHAVAVVKVGVFSTVRVMLYVFGVDTMNALNLGLPVIENRQAVEDLVEGDRLEIDFRKGNVTNLRLNKSYPIKPLPPFLLEMLEADGLVAYYKKYGRLPWQKAG